jgi:hypothetical protein
MVCGALARAAQALLQVVQFGTQLGHFVLQFGKALIIDGRGE